MFKFLLLYFVITFYLYSVNLDKTQEMSIISLLSHSIHTLQKERGASSGYISSYTDKFKNELVELKNDADISMHQLEKFLITEHKNHHLNTEYHTFKEVIKNIKELRISVINRDIDFERLFAEYTNNISIMIMLITSLSDEFINDEVKSKLQNYSYLLIYKESVGQKRSILTALFSENKDFKKLYQYYLTADMKEKIALKRFLNSTNKAVYVLYAKYISNESVKRVVELEKIAMKRFAEINISVDSKEWFKVVTEKMNLIRAFKEQIFYEIKHQVFNKLNLTQEELDWRESHIVRIGIEDWTPIMFPTSKNGFDGIAGDFLKQVIHISNLKFEIKTGLWNDLLNDFKQQKLDLLPATYYTKQRAQFGLYGKGYFTMKDALFIKDNNIRISSLQDLKHKKLAIIKGFATIDKISEELPDINIIETQNLDESIFKVLNGEVDALFDGSITIKTKIKQDLIIGLKEVPQNYLKAFELHLFSNINEPLLKSILEKALAAIPQNERDKIISKWIEDNNAQTIVNIRADESISFQGIITENLILLPLILFLIVILLIKTKFIQKYILHINIKTFNILIISFELITIVILIFQIAVLDRTENKLSTAQITKFKILNAVTELKQSSDNLTHFARAYVTTGDIKYKQQYLDVLKIRSGDMHRPKNYNSIYWSLSPEVRAKRYPSSASQSLESIFQNLPLLDYERKKLIESKNNSDQLVNLEVQAFQAVEVGDLDLAKKLLYSKEYNLEKYKIMLPIDDFIFLVNERTNVAIQDLNIKVKNEFYLIFILGIIFIIANIVIFIMSHHKINIPVEYLISIMKKFQNGDKNIQKQIFYNDEIGEMNREFFYMKGLIDLHTKDIEKFNKNIKDSIKFSSLIQQALLPEHKIIEKYTKDFFTFWKPRDVVGGDIYFITELDNSPEIIVMIIDGAGHGVPGAFVTMLVKAIETQIIADINIGKLESSPAKILGYFNKYIKTMLKQEKGSKSKSNAGFDGGVFYFNKETRVCKYAGAKTPLYIIRNNTLEIFKSDRKNIGFIRTKYDQEYTEFYMKLDNSVTNLYLATDGIIDQEGGNDSRFGKGKFERLLLEHHKKPFSEQKQLLLDSFENFKSDFEQSDDITVIGLQF